MKGNICISMYIYMNEIFMNIENTCIIKHSLYSNILHVGINKIFALINFTQNCNITLKRRTCENFPSILYMYSTQYTRSLIQSTVMLLASPSPEYSVSVLVWFIISLALISSMLTETLYLTILLSLVVI